MILPIPSIRLGRTKQNLARYRVALKYGAQARSAYLPLLWRVPVFIFSFGLATSSLPAAAACVATGLNVVCDGVNTGYDYAGTGAVNIINNGQAGTEGVQDNIFTIRSRLPLVAEDDFQDPVGGPEGWRLTNNGTIGGNNYSVIVSGNDGVATFAAGSSYTGSGSAGAAILDLRGAGNRTIFADGSAVRREEGAATATLFIHGPNNSVEIAGAVDTMAGQGFILYSAQYATGGADTLSASMKNVDNGHVIVRNTAVTHLNRDLLRVAGMGFDPATGSVLRRSTGFRTEIEGGDHEAQPLSVTRTL